MWRHTCEKTGHRGLQQGHSTLANVVEETDPGQLYLHVQWPHKRQLRTLRVFTHAGPPVFTHAGPPVFTQTGPPVFTKGGPLVFTQTGPG